MQKLIIQSKWASTYRICGLCYGFDSAAHSRNSAFELRSNCSSYDTNLFVHRWNEFSDINRDTSVYFMSTRNFSSILLLPFIFELSNWFDLVEKNNEWELQRKMNLKWVCYKNWWMFQVKWHSDDFRVASSTFQTTLAVWCYALVGCYTVL